MSTLRLALVAFALTSAWGTTALAAPPEYDFSFADDTSVLPPGVAAADVLTIATERDGDRSHGVLLLVGGSALYFETVESRPLLRPEAARDAFAALGK